MARFLNPYNFVRPLEKPAKIDELLAKDPETWTQEEIDQILLWRCPPPPHDRYTGLSGRITCTMTAKTPVFVSDSEIISEQNGHKSYRFFNVDGQDMIPASSLRGSIRSVFEAATNSTWSIFSDKQLSYRENSDFARGLIPGRLAYDSATNIWSVVLLPGKSAIDFDASEDRSRYYPLNSPLTGNGDPFLYAAWLPQGLASTFEHGQVCYAVLSENPHHRHFRYFRVTHLDTDPNALPRGGTPVPGVVCRTGENNIGNKHDERFFFATQTYTYTIDENVIKRYNAAIEERRAYFKDNSDQFQYKPSRYLTEVWDKECIHPENPLITGADYRFPVYVRLSYNEVTKQHKVDYLAPVAMPRVPEKATFFEVLEREGFHHMLPSDNYNQLSPADRVFGWVHQKGDDDLTQSIAYRGRVRFSHAKTEGTPETLARMSLSILSAPKPTTTRFYINWRKKNKHGRYVNAIKQEMGDERTDAQRPSDDDLRYGKRGNMLRGRKFYRHHGLFKRGEAEIHDTRSNSDQNRSILGAHQEGTTYSFTIEFENLQPVELGALLWSLELSDEFIYDDHQSVKFEGYHRIGYGKPLGFGSVKIGIRDVTLFDAQDRYTNAIAKDKTLYEGEDRKKVVQLLSMRFRQGFGTLYGKAFERLTNIVDLCTLLSDPVLGEDISIHYPRPRHQRGKYRMSNGRTGDNNYEWFRDNKRPTNSGGPNLVLVYAPSDVDGFPHLIWDNQARRVNIVDE